MTSDKSSDKRPPQKPKPPLPSEDPSLMLQTSSNRPLPSPRVEAEYRELKRINASPAKKSSGFTIVTCLVVLIGLMILLYFLLQYFR